MQKYGGDNPDNSICSNFSIQEDDIIVVGSDGLFDNIFPLEILLFIKEAL
jgi:hypothetical protein